MVRLHGARQGLTRQEARGVLEVVVGADEDAVLVGDLVAIDGEEDLAGVLLLWTVLHEISALEVDHLGDLPAR